MKKDRINTTSIREIKNSFKRFLSLLVMSMLGVSVFVGIKMSAPDMIESIDKYYDDNNVYDIKLISTLGLTDGDLSIIKNLDGIQDAYGAYSKDALIKVNNQEKVIKVIGLKNDVNKIQIKAGREPKNNNEIAIEEYMMISEKINIGDKVKLLDSETFKETDLEIVGIIKSPLYITSSGGSVGRGNTNIGSGKINYYAYVNETNFNIDYYTESYIIIKDTKNELTNTKKYNELISNIINKINEVKVIRQEIRYNDIYNKIDKEIQKNEKIGLKEFNIAKSKLVDTEATLAKGKEFLDNAKKELSKSLEELNDFYLKLKEAKLLLIENNQKLEAAKIKIEEGKTLINSKLENYGITIEEIKQISDNIKNYEVPKEDVINLIPTDADNYEEIVDFVDKIYDSDLKNKIESLINSPNKKEDIINLIPTDIDNYEEIIKFIDGLSEEDITEEIINYITNPDNIDDFINLIPTDIPNYDKIIEIIEFYKQDPNKIIDLMIAIKEIESAERQYNDGILQYDLALSEYNNNYNLYEEYYKQYQLGLNDYEQGMEQYNNNLNLYKSKESEYYVAKTNFEQKISESKKQLDLIPESKWYSYARIDDSGYSSYIDDGESVSNLSKIFPTIFFAVAILISLISMSRMVEDDRLLIGTLKSLGFSNRYIRRKYLLYSGLATLAGGLIGSFLGFYILPAFIWNVYKILFDVPVFKYNYNPTNILIGILISVVCICGATLLTIEKIVKEKPSDLMRPKSPKNGKRVILEKIPFIWNRINFSNKITIRNLFRYKKRVFMTIGGILGCTSLMLAGFGIRDSIINIPGKQFNEIFKFDEMVYITKDLGTNELDNIFDNEHILNRLDTKMDTSMTSQGYSINLFVPENSKNLKNVLKLRDINTSKGLNLKNNAVIISDKLAQLQNKKVGDKITIEDSLGNKYKFIISGICENYVGHYIFMDKQTYENNIDKYVTNITYLNINNLENEELLSKELLKNDGIMSIVSANNTIKSVENMLKSLNSVVLILIVLSGTLSFVVLYNLSYINISERKREIATLKVLGFTDREVDNYITKEIIILTLIGIGLGLLFGIVLTNIIIDTVELEMVRFLHKINPSSFIITSTIIMIFTVIVNKIIHFTLKKIDMIESLKSVE